MAHEFVPIDITIAMRSKPSIQSLQGYLQVKVLSEWELGRKGPYISSRLVTWRGTMDTLTSTDPNDKDYGGLAEAHLGRLSELLSSDARGALSP